MSAQLKIQKEVKGTAVIELGHNGSLSFEEVTVYMNEWSEKDLILMIIDKNDPNNKIQLTLVKPTEFVEVKKEDPVTETPKS